MYNNENRSAIALGLIMAFRMLGLFMILPVFSLYTHRMPGATPVMVGLALGIYGLTQGCLQIPFGACSDYFGRKPVIATGLILFIIGSLIAAMSHHISGIIIGRAIQGGGAIGSTTLALLSDLSRDERRSRAMAMIGLSIGLAFALAMVIGPMINTWWHLSGIFYLTAAFGCISLILLYTAVPAEPAQIVPKKSGGWKNILTKSALLRLYQGIFSLHAILTALFIAIPIILHEHFTSHTFLIYLVVLGLSFVFMLPFIIMAEKKRRMKATLIGAVLTLALCCLSLLISHNWIVIATTLCLFFTAFTLLEASLPSLVSKISPIERKGMAMGIYSSAQFFGIFFGGSIGGWTFGHFGAPGIFILCIIIALIWLISAISMPQPPYLSTQLIQTETSPSDNMLSRLKQTPGITECLYRSQENLLYLKIDKQKISIHELRKLIETGNL